MLIDWFTVGAQVLNFIILVWLMKRYLYHPVLDAIATREQKIATELADAAATKAQAQQQQSEFEEKHKAFEQQKAAMMQAAKETAAAEGERLRAEAIEAADETSKARAKTLLIDTQHLHTEMVAQVQQQVFDITRRVLGDLADVSLEQRACEVFIERLQTLDGAARAALKAMLTASSETAPALLRSAFELPPALRTAIQAALDDALDDALDEALDNAPYKVPDNDTDDTFGQSVTLRFETAPELVAGIELSAQGQKLAWSIADYLKSLSLTPQAGADDDHSMAAT